MACISDTDYSEELDRAHPDDRVLLQNIIAMVNSLQSPRKFTRRWHLQRANNETTRYFLTCLIPRGVFNISLSTLESIRNLNTTRVWDITLRPYIPDVESTGDVSDGDLEMIVSIIPADVPIIQTEVDVIRVRTRKRWRSN
jgi:hypothetical protein